MSILDTHNDFADAQAVTASAISAKVIDLGDDVTTRNIGGPGAAYLVVQTQTAATSGTSAATLTVTLESDSAEGLSASPTTHYSTGAKSFAAFSPAGTVLAVVPLPFGDYERYLGVRFTVGTENLTAGKFDAFLTRDPQYWRAMTANNPAAN